MNEKNQLLLDIMQGKVSRLLSWIKEGKSIDFKKQYPKKPGEVLASPIHVAAGEGKLKILKILIENGADINSSLEGRFGFENSPLFLAAAGGHESTARFLLKHGADIEQLNHYENTILDAACMGGSLRLVKFLFKNFKWNNMEKEKGPVYYAAIKGNTEVVDFLIKKGMKWKTKAILCASACGGMIGLLREFLDERYSVNQVDANGLTLLHNAAEEGNLQAVRFLLESGAAINALVEEGYYKNFTPLFFAAQGGHFQVLQYLIEQGAEINLKGDYEQSPLTLAIESGSVETMKVLVNAGADIHSELGYILAEDFRNKNFLFWAVEKGHSKLLEACIQNGSDVNCNDFIGNVPLQFAVENGDSKSVKLLLEAGADMNSHSGLYEQSPLHIACRTGNKEIADYLIEKGADLSLKDRNENTLLHGAAEGGLITVVSFLIKNGFDINAQNQFGDTPLHAAIKSRKNRVAGYLIKNGADPALKGLSAQTALHLACQFEKTTVLISSILKSGVNINQKDESYEHNTPLHIAVSVKNKKAIYKLIRYGAELNVLNSSGNSPLILAAESGELELVKALIENGADMTLSHQDSWGALAAALAANHMDVVDYLLKQSDSISSVNEKYNLIDEQLLLAAKDGNWAGVYQWLERDAFVNVRDKIGFSPLHYAALQANVGIVELLIQHNADVEQKDRNGKKPIDLLDVKNSDFERVLSLLAEPPVLLDEVEHFARYLRPRFPEYSPEKAFEILNSFSDDKKLAAVTKKEINRLSIITGDELKKLINHIIEVRKNTLLHFGTCRFCGRDTVQPTGREVIHGSLGSPSVDTEVLWKTVCLSCGKKNDIYV